MSLEPTAHIIFFAVEAWGHTRPLCTLALRLIQERPLYITFFTAPSFVKRIENEISRNFGPETEHLRELIRVVGLNTSENGFLNTKYFYKYMDLFAESYQMVVDEQPITCAVTGKEIKPVIPPEAMIMDFFCTPAMEAARRISRKPVKIYAWMSGQASFIIHPYAPKHWGGRDDIRPTITEEVAKSGRPLEEVAYEILVRPTSGSVVRTPGIPPMYDHEYKPQAVPTERIQGFITLMMHSFLDQCDGLILSTAEPYESEAIARITEWYGETSREVYTFGHLLPVNENAAVGEQRQSEKAEEISQFLQKTLDTDGHGTLLYISFGSIFWPMDPEKIWAFLDVVMEKQLPFIFSHASPFGHTLPDEVVAKVNAYGKGLLSKWSPQQTILSHPATGWFVTHAGQNSVMEAMTLGVPMICWPFSADQPTNSARLSFVLDVAYELFEVRAGPHGSKPIHRIGKAPLGTIEAVRDEARSVLKSAFGADGARKRSNMKKLQQAVLNTWSENGPARRDLRRFVATLHK
ncbi:hypothetical protein QCA50_015121 [Cerrena zonata]|uniref:Glycosyltransferase n=1 Tax=Cerrena zonata TaxID=2478898 RepID=A0AAW0FU41_9APHY